MRSVLYNDPMLDEGAWGNGTDESDQPDGQQSWFVAPTLDEISENVFILFTVLLKIAVDACICAGAVSFWTSTRFYSY